MTSAPLVANRIHNSERVERLVEGISMDARLHVERESYYEKFALFRGAIFMLRVIGYSPISFPLSVRPNVAHEGSTIVLTAAPRSKPRQVRRRAVDGTSRILGRPRTPGRAAVT
jgi:hypothetical protein